MLFDIRKTLWFSKLMFVLQQLDFPLILFTSILFNGPQVLPLGKTLPALKVEEKDSIVMLVARKEYKHTISP